MNFKFQSEDNKKFYTLLASNLKEELDFIYSIAKGDAQARQDIGDKYVRGASAILGLVGAAFPIAPYAGIIVGLVGDVRKARNKLDVKDFVASLQRYQFGKQSELYLNLIAREATYQFGSLLENMKAKSHGFDQNPDKAFQLLAKVGAMRIMFYAMNERIPLEDSQKIVMGLIEGFQGFRGDELSHSFGGAKWFHKITGGGDESFTVEEGFYARSGFVDKRSFAWSQPVTTPAYHIALAAGHLASRDISDRVRIWSEPEVVDAARYQFAETDEFLTAAEEITGCPYKWGRYDVLSLSPSFPCGGMENPCLTFATPTLLTGDRSLADVMAYDEIAHSWTGKIACKIREDEECGRLSAQFDWKALKDNVARGGPDGGAFSSLVWPLVDQDPDNTFSRVYEKGFNLLNYLESLIGREHFEDFAKSYIDKLKFSTVTSGQFKDHFLAFCQELAIPQQITTESKAEIEATSSSESKGKKNNKNNKNKKPAAPTTASNSVVLALLSAEVFASLVALDWQQLLHGRGLPTYTLDFSNSLSIVAEVLAAGKWILYMQGWSTMQMSVFLETLQVFSKEQGLEQEDFYTDAWLRALDSAYGFSERKNAEVLLRWQIICLGREVPWIVSHVVQFIMSQGLMKYDVRPLYRSLLRHSTIGSRLAVETFEQNQKKYHPIARKMLVIDLAAVAEKESREQKSPRVSTTGVRMWILFIIGLIFMPLSLAAPNSQENKHLNVRELRQRQREHGFEESFIRVHDVLKAVKFQQWFVEVFESKNSAEFIEPLSSSDVFHNTTITYTLLSKGITYVSLDSKLHRDAVKYLDDEQIVSCDKHSTSAHGGVPYGPADILIASIDIHTAMKASSASSKQLNEYLGSDTMKKNKGFSILRRVISTASGHGQLTPLLRGVTLAADEHIDHCRVHRTETIHPMELLESFDIKSNVSHPFHVMNVLDKPPAEMVDTTSQSVLTNDKNVLAIPTPVPPLKKCDDTSFWYPSFYETGIINSGSNYMYKIFSTSACADYSNTMPGSFNMNYDYSTKTAVNKNMFITAGVTCIDCYAYLGAEYYIHVEYSISNGFGFEAQINGGAGAKVAVSVQNPSISSTNVVTLVNNGELARYVNFVVFGSVTVGIRFRKLVASISGSGSAVGSAVLSGGSGASASLTTLYAGGALQFHKTYTPNSKPWEFSTTGFQMTSFSVSQSLTFYMDLKISLLSTISATFELKPTAFVQYSYDSSASFTVSVTGNSRRRLDEHDDVGRFIVSPTKSGDIVHIVIEYSDFQPNENTIAYISVVRGEIHFPVMMHHFTSSDTGAGVLDVAWTVPWDSELCDFDSSGLGKDSELEVEVHCSNNLHNVVRSSDIIVAWLYGESDSIFDSPTDKEIVSHNQPYNLTWNRNLLKYYQVEDSFSGYGMDITAETVSLFVVGEAFTTNGTQQLTKYDLIGYPVNNTGFKSVLFPSNISALGDRFYMQIESNAKPEVLAWSSGYFQFQAPLRPNVTSREVTDAESISSMISVDRFMDFSHSSRKVEPTAEQAPEKTISIDESVSHAKLANLKRPNAAFSVMLVSPTSPRTHFDLQGSCSSSSPAYLTFGVQFSVSFTAVDIIFSFSLSNTPTAGPFILFKSEPLCAGGGIPQTAKPTRLPVGGPTAKPSIKSSSFPLIQAPTRGPTSNNYICAAGTYNYGGLCYYCPAGSFQPYSGSTGCYACPAGTYNTQYGMEVCYFCDVGYSSVEGATICTACAVGTYAGVYDNYWGQLPTCYSCPPGAFNPYTASSTCYSCADGYSSNYGAGYCVPCAAGSYSDFYNDYYQSCYYCGAGSFQPYNARDYCYQCIPGTYSQDGASSCTNCPQGSFNTVYESEYCYYCPTGSTAEPGSTTCSECPAGSYYALIENTEYYYNYYAMVFELSTCYQCTPGYYQPSQGATTCLTCEAGTFSGYAATSCTNCPTNSFNMMAGSSECYECPSGTTSVAGSSKCHGIPSVIPSASPSVRPSACPTAKPTTATPSAPPSLMPSYVPSTLPSTVQPTTLPTPFPNIVPTAKPSVIPSVVPTTLPTLNPTHIPTHLSSTVVPTVKPSTIPTTVPTAVPTVRPTIMPTVVLTGIPSMEPSVSPTEDPSAMPTITPTAAPTVVATVDPVSVPTAIPTIVPLLPTIEPSQLPTTLTPTRTPTARPSQFPITFKPTSNDITNPPTVRPSVLSQPLTTFSLGITSTGYTTDTQLNDADRAAFAQATCVSMGMSNNLGACTVTEDTMFTLLTARRSLLRNDHGKVRLFSEYSGRTTVKVAVILQNITQQYASAIDFYDATLATFTTNFDNGSFSQNLYEAAVEHQATIALQAFPVAMEATAVETINPADTTRTKESTSIIFIIVIVVSVLICVCGVAVYFRFLKSGRKYKVQPVVE